MLLLLITKQDFFLIAAISGVCIISSASVVGPPVGIASAIFTLIFALTEE